MNFGMLGAGDQRGLKARLPLSPDATEPSERYFRPVCMGGSQEGVCLLGLVCRAIPSAEQQQQHLSSGCGTASQAHQAQRPLPALQPQHRSPLWAQLVLQTLLAEVPESGQLPKCLRRSGNTAGCSLQDGCQMGSSSNTWGGWDTLTCPGLHIYSVV